MTDESEVRPKKVRSFHNQLKTKSDHRVDKTNQMK